MYILNIKKDYNYWNKRIKGEILFIYLWDCARCGQKSNICFSIPFSNSLSDILSQMFPSLCWSIMQLEMLFWETILSMLRLGPPSVFLTDSKFIIVIVTVILRDHSVHAETGAPISFLNWQPIYYSRCALSLLKRLITTPKLRTFRHDF